MGENQTILTTGDEVQSVLTAVKMVNLLPEGGGSSVSRGDGGENSDNLNDSERYSEDIDDSGGGVNILLGSGAN